MRLTYTLLAALLVASSAADVRQTARNPGSIVLLAETEAHAADAVLREALVDPNPGVRFIAARVTAAGAHIEMLGSIIGALLREQDQHTGSELIRAALHLGGERDLALIDGQVKRLGGQAAVAKAEWLARVRPVQFLETLPRFAGEETAEVASLAAMVAMAQVQHPELRAALLDAWMRVAPRYGWRDLLDIRYGAPAAIERATDLLKNALASNRPLVREETVWFLVSALSGRRKVPRALLDAAVAADPPDASDWERFGRELIARRHTKARTPDRSALLATEDPRRRIAVAIEGLPELLDTERAAVARLVQSRSQFLEPDWHASPPATRTVSLPVPGLVPATFEAAGCTGAEEMGQAVLSYWPDGRPVHIRLAAGKLPPPCVKALSALARLSVADLGYPVTKNMQTVVVPFHQAYIDCHRQSSQASWSRPAESPAVVTTPRLIREVKPNYTREAVRERIEGVVVLTARVNERGCVETAEVVRSLPHLDAAAIWAVTQWLFEPARAHGDPVPSRVSIELTFKL